MKSEPTEKPRGKKTAASETADRKNGRSPSPGHDGWWERLMMEPGPGESTGTDAEPVIPSGAVAEEVSGETVRKDTPAEPEDPVRRRTSGQAAQGLAGGVPGNIPHRPEDQEPQDGVRQ